MAIALFGVQLQLCFIDEAGDLGVLGDPPAPNDQPFLVVAGLFVDAARLASLTDEYLNLKYRFFPNLSYPSTRHLDRILPEIKAAELRKNATRGNARQKGHATGFKFSTFPNYERLVELPTFGHSDNHAGLQICDIVCSGLMYPIACFAYCTGHVNNVHVQSGASRLRSRYGQQLKDLQHRYYDVGTKHYVGGVVVSDAVNQKSGALMFGN